MNQFRDNNEKQIFANSNNIFACINSHYRFLFWVNCGTVRIYNVKVSRFKNIYQ